MKMGYSFRSFAGTLYEKYGVSVHEGTLRTWSDKFPEFGEAKKTAYSLALKFFEKFLRYHILGAVPQELKDQQNTKMSSTMVIFTLKTRFFKEYGDQLKLQGVEGGTPIKTENIHIPDYSKVPKKNLLAAKKLLELE